MKIDTDGGPVYDIYGAIDYLRDAHGLNANYDNLKHHVWASHRLQPDGQAGKRHPCFKQSTLDAFAAIPDIFKRGRRWYKRESEGETDT